MHRDESIPMDIGLTINPLYMMSSLIHIYPMKINSLTVWSLANLYQTLLSPFLLLNDMLEKVMNLPFFIIPHPNKDAVLW